ncbi:mechanosensitive ion channel family protein, partial [Pseudomonas aeruginosa]|uniref:mechanosensitive ion channel family protein n=1 Tax=Pseudomonas aeruginosa TaxID=287 RepID=UPI0039A037F7|nr:mechanosensitive ion channel family protein [Pseudomonas aeruginosa]
MELNYDRLVQQTESWLPIVLEYSGKVALALLTLAIGWWLINTLTGRVGGLLARRSVDRTLQGFVGSLVSIVLKILLVVSVASMIGIQTTSFVGPPRPPRRGRRQSQQRPRREFPGGRGLTRLRPAHAGRGVGAPRGGR